MHLESETFFLTRFYFQRSLGAIYGVGFLIALNQFRALCGRNGILPMPLYLKHSNFWDAPSLFWINQSDSFVIGLALIGLVLSIFATVGYSDAFGISVSLITWFLLWVIYSSFVNVGQTFYSFGWEILLLETGFLAVFMGPSASPPSIILIFLLRWLLFRLMFGAGLIKIRGDECWRDLTCMKYHYETMPLPGPTSWYFHYLPQWIHKFSILFNHFTELIVPFFYFAPRPLNYLAGIFTILFQGVIIVSGNFSWLNHVSIVIAIACFDDGFLVRLGPWLNSWAAAMGVPVQSGQATAGGLPAPILYLLTAVIVFLSVRPALNLISKRQIMNTSFDPFHIVNTYGAFGSITRVRNEVIIEGAMNENGPWTEYEFKGKPGDPARMPPLVSPYHYKLDWQMWFAAMSPYNYHPWIVNLVAKLLAGDPRVLALMGPNPFPEKPPKYIRASLYEYHYTKPGEKNWWRRNYAGEYLPVLSLDNPGFRETLKQQGWLN
jgi:hypothetical protein